MPRKQILIYPALNNCYTEESPYRSVQENGEGYLLTAVKMEDYLKLYESSPDDRQNPYFAPILEKDLSHMPDTLILTAEFDPCGTKEKHTVNAWKKRETMWKCTGSRKHFTAILHWGSGSFMCRKALRS